MCSELTNVRAECRGHSRLHVASSLLVPDVTPEAHITEVSAQAAINLANSLSPLDIIVRTAVEVAAVALAAYLVRRAVSKLTKKAKKVLCWIPCAALLLEQALDLQTAL